ncbi:TRADD-N-associated membrane domain-containing protein [Actinacidiphila paucisporea]|uniref:Membrane-associated phospholipid phosphatase n=1 Tax=Actinacidiphila paucisporea TaxID=310782 RepID=A0A1M7N335_9ACTN|nr:hypothetical protein [Actinacidiphila paucisporea]SHM97835.1 Membrane-associated phospholipid phosphatase [Actinacidiphila paucisporea]
MEENAAEQSVERAAPPAEVEAGGDRSPEQAGGKDAEAADDVREEPRNDARQLLVNAIDGVGNLLDADKPLSTLLYGFLRLPDATMRRLLPISRYLRRLVITATFLLLLPASGYLTYYVAQEPEYQDKNRDIAGFSVGYLALVLLMGSLVVLFLGLVATAARTAERERQVEQAAKRLRENMELPAIVEFNRVLLDQYHDIATRQANKSFRSGLAAMGVGMAVIAGAAALSFTLSRTSEQLVVGGVAALGSALSGYLGRTYMMVYKQALAQMNHYFNQPVLNGYFLAAERIANNLEASGQREEALRQIVTSVLEAGNQAQTAAGTINPAAAPAPPSAARRATRTRRAAARR